MLDQLMQGGGAGGALGPPPSIALPGGPPAAPGGAGGIPGEPDNPDSAGALKSAIDAVDAYLKAEVDDQDKSVAAQVLAKLHGLQGGRAKEADAAMGTTPAMKMVRRSAQG